MNKSRRVDLRGILANPDLRRELMVSTLQATQAREGIDTTREQAERAYYIVTEGERSTFFDLDRFRGDSTEPDRRQEMFVRALRDEVRNVRFDVARRDFGSIEGSPLAYRRVGLISHIFSEAPALEPAWGIAAQGLATAKDERFVRNWWEVPSEAVGEGKHWARFAKGGEFSRFYADVYLVVNWRDDGSDIRSFQGAYIRNEQHYFRPGLTWPLRTVKGFNVRVMPSGCVFGHKGPAIIPSQQADTFFILGVTNSAVAEYLLQGLTSVGSWEVGVVKRLPIPSPNSKQRENIARLSRAIYDAKSLWDEGNEMSTRFQKPWLLREDFGASEATVLERLDYLAEYELAEEGRIRKLYAELNDEVYKFYGIPDSTRLTIEETLGKRPSEILWPQMEGKVPEQKRMEHIFRLLAYVVKRLVDADEEAMVPFVSGPNEPSLLDRVRVELQECFPSREISQVEVEIANELKKEVKGYRRTVSIEQWLQNVFFEYHCSLYKNRPVVWHIASAQGAEPFAFGELISYHRFDRNGMQKMRGQHLREAIDNFRREVALADKAGQTERRLEWQERLEEAQELDRRLQLILEGHHKGPVGGAHDCRILTPWKSPENRPRGWEPDLDDGVKVNIEPLQKAGVLRILKVV